MKAAYLPWYTRDWRSDPKVALLAWEERSLYRDMIDLSWELGALPDDALAVVRAIGAPERMADLVPAIFKRFWTKAAGGWRNPRLERERKRTKELLDRRVDLGKKGAAARWEKERQGRVDAVSNAHCMPQACGEHAAGTAYGMPRAPEPDPVPSTPVHRVLDSSSLRSDEGASAPDVLPGIEIKPHRGKREPSQAVVDGFVSRNAWQRCWLAQFGTRYTDLKGRKSAAVRTAFVRLGRDEGELERLIGAFLVAPPFKHRENPDPIAFLDSLASVAAGLNGKANGRYERAPTLDERNATTLLNTMEELAREA